MYPYYFYLFIYIIIWGVKCRRKTRQEKTSRRENRRIIRKTSYLKHIKRNKKQTFLTPLFWVWDVERYEPS